MTKLERLCEAIKEYEGWHFMSRSWRNNNPGNLKYSKFQSGHDGTFAKFNSFGRGWLALYWDLFCKCTGNTKTGLNKESDLYNLFNIWAPRSDNNEPNLYAEFVAKKLEISPNTKLSYFLEDLRDV